MTIRMATIDEQVVNTAIFGKCNHRSWGKHVDKYECEYLVCADCGCEFLFKSFDLPDDFSGLSESDYLLAQIRRYEDEDVLASLIIRQVEGAGWRAQLTERGGGYVCTIERGSDRFASDVSISRSIAVCSSAARLGRSRLFSINTAGHLLSDAR